MCAVVTRPRVRARRIVGVIRVRETRIRTRLLRHAHPRDAIGAVLQTPVMAVPAPARAAALTIVETMCAIPVKRVLRAPRTAVEAAVVLVATFTPVRKPSALRMGASGV